MGSEEILVSGGVAAMLGGVVGGGLKAFGIEVPLLATVKRQALAVAVGFVLVALGLLSGSGILGPKPAQTGARPAQTGTAAADGGGSSATAPGKATPGASFENQAPQGGPPGAPDMLGMGFPQARRLIVAAGWSPIPQEAAPLDNPALGLRGEEVEASGFREAAYCGGTGAGACLMRYRQSNHVLEVVVLGDTLESGVVDMYDVLGCNARPRPDGCAAERS